MSAEEAKTHRETYPEQYSHPLVGKEVRFGKTGVARLVNRVVVSARWGLMLHCLTPGCGAREWIYRAQDVDLVKSGS